MCNCNELAQLTLPTGPSGNTPYIGGNNNWWINGVDTGVLAEGQDGIYADVAAYKVLISQVGTNAPTTTVVFASPNSNYFGIWARTGAGAYTLTAPTGIFIAGKFIAYFVNTDSSITGVFGIRRLSTQVLLIESLTDLLVNQDSLLNGVLVIEVYP